MVRIIIERRFRPDKEKAIEDLLIELRIKAMQQHGFLSGETLRSIDDPMLWLVISTWLDDDMWRTWEDSPERQNIMSKMEPLMFVPEKVSVFKFISHSIPESAYAIKK